MKNDYRSVRNRVTNRIGALNTRLVEANCDTNGLRCLDCLLGESRFTVKEAKAIASNITDVFIWSWSHESHQPTAIELTPMVTNDILHKDMRYWLKILGPPYFDPNHGYVINDRYPVTHIISALPSASSLLMDRNNFNLMRSDVDIKEMLGSLPKNTMVMYDILIGDVSAPILIEEHDEYRDMVSSFPDVDNSTLRLARIATLLYSSPIAMLIDRFIKNISYFYHDDNKRPLQSWYHQVIKDDSWSDSWYDVFNSMVFGSIIYLKKVETRDRKEFESLMRTRFWNDRFWNIENVRALASLPYTVVMENARMGDYVIMNM
jgi:hypothetical protein